jgi:hypothetical protein
MSASSGEVPRDCVAWLMTLEPSMEKYGGLLAKHGFETTYALGLLTTPEELQDPVGLWEDDARFLFSQLLLKGPRSLRNQWARHLSRIPTNTSMRQFFESSPVPLLAQHVGVLADHGFDGLASFKNLAPEDLENMKSVALGHRLALIELAMLMDDPVKIPSTISLDLTTFLANIVPSVHHFLGAIRLEKPKLESVTDFMMIRREEVLSLRALLPGHRRLLWNIIIRLRTHWVDPV